jgi:hypothetical protein
MKTVYLKINKLTEQSRQMRELAGNKDVNFKQAEKIREEQDKIYNKLEFFKNFVKVKNQLEG